MTTLRRLTCIGAAAAILLSAGCGGSDGATPGGDTTTSSTTSTTAPRQVLDQTSPRSTFGLAFDDRYLWVADFYGSQVLGIDPNTGEIMKRYKGEDGVPEGIDDLTVGPDGSLFWTGFNDGQVGRMTPAAISTVVEGLLPGAGPIAFSPDGKLFVGRAVIGHGIYELDPNGEKKQRVVTERAGNINGFAVGSDGAIYGPRFGLGADGPASGALVRIDPNTGQTTDIATGFDAPVAVKLSPDGRVAFVLSQVPGGTAKVSTVDLSTRAVADLAEVLTPLVDNLAIDGNGRVFVSSFNQPVLTVINPDRTTSTITIGTHPAPVPTQ